MATSVIRDFRNPLSPQQRVNQLAANLGPLAQGAAVEPQTAPEDQQDTLASPAVSAASYAPSGNGSAVQMSVQRRMDNIAQTNARLRGIADAARARQSAGEWGGQSGAWSPQAGVSASRNKILQLASNYIGSPYQLGGTTKRGIDCSGLVMMVYRQLGLNLSHYVPSQVKQVPGVRTSIANLKPGDLVAWKDGSHIAIYAGNGQIIESAYGYGARRTNLYSNQVYGISVRLPGE